MTPRRPLLAVALLLLGTVVSGCRHKAPAPPPPPAPAKPAAAPPAPSSTITVITPLPSVPPEAKRDVQPGLPPAAAPTPKKVKGVHKEHRKPATQTASTSTPGAANPAGSPANSSGTANAPAGSPPRTGLPAGTSAGAETPPAPDTPPSTSGSTAQEAAPALGELSTGGAISSSERTRMMSQIQVQEGRLSKVKEPTTSDGQVIELQVHAFLAKARQLVAENDLDGAQTLTVKARVLIDELQSE